MGPPSQDQEILQANDDLIDEDKIKENKSDNLSQTSQFGSNSNKNSSADIMSDDIKKQSRSPNKIVEKERDRPNKSSNEAIERSIANSEEINNIVDTPRQARSKTRKGSNNKEKIIKSNGLKDQKQAHQEQRNKGIKMPKNKRGRPRKITNKNTEQGLINDEEIDEKIKSQITNINEEQTQQNGSMDGQHNPDKEPIRKIVVRRAKKVSKRAVGRPKKSKRINHNEVDKQQGHIEDEIPEWKTTIVRRIPKEEIELVKMDQVVQSRLRKTPNKTIEEAKGTSQYIYCEEGGNMDSIPKKRRGRPKKVANQNSGQDLLSNKKPEEKEADEIASRTMRASKQKELTNKNKEIKNSNIESSESKEIHEGMSKSKTSDLNTMEINNFKDNELVQLKNQVSSSKSNIKKVIKNGLTMDNSNDDSYATIRQKLHVSAVPSELPGREEELNNISEHLINNIQEKSSCCIYISGVPGTGKTASVQKVVKKMMDLVEKKQLNDFNFLEINGMQLTEPNQIYTKIWEAFSGKQFSVAHAETCLKEYFLNLRDSKNRPLWVIMVDELDLLMTKNQSVLYNLFEWSNLPDGKIILLSIANTMDLPERMLKNKIISRMGLIRVVFNPYNHIQLQQIVKSRLLNAEWFEKDAIEICSRKVAAVSGDARRALDICRRAVELIELDLLHKNEYNGKVTMKVINQAIQEMYKSPVISIIQSSSFQQKVLLISLFKLIKKDGMLEFNLIDIYQQHLSLCKLSNWLQPTIQQFKITLSGLINNNLIISSDFPRLSTSTLISLNFRESDISTALKIDSSFANLLN